MFKRSGRLASASILLILLGASGATVGGTAPVSDAGTPAECETELPDAIGAFTPCVPWMQTWGPGGKNYTQTTDVQVSPDGTRVHVLGHAGWSNYNRTEGHREIYVRTYAAATGDPLWTYRYTHENDRHAMALSPDGTRVHLMVADGRPGTPQPSLIALDAHSGDELWTFTHPKGWDSYDTLALDPLGTRLFVRSYAGGVQAHDALTGTLLWDTADTDEERLADDTLPDEVALRFTESALQFHGDLAVTADGARVLTVGMDWPDQIEARAYDTTTGVILWDVALEPLDLDAFLWSDVHVVASPDGTRAHVLAPVTGGFQVFLVDTATGNTLESERVVIDPVASWCSASHMVAHASTGHAYAAASCRVKGNLSSIAGMLLAFNASSATPAWVHATEEARWFMDLDVAPDGATVYATSYHGLDAHAADTGAHLWGAYDTYQGPETLYPRGLAVGSDGERLYLMGHSMQSYPAHTWTHDWTG